ncbi:hypothetical protein, partial [Corynebacterium accolens]|uniref:hypothetical protein n=1 Tax=Corynebacterium accolens TaxID=38284 RepID=UPI00254F1A2D
MIVFNFLSPFLPRRVGEAVYFFFVVIFGRQHEPLLVCGGLFFWLGLGFSRPFQDFVVLKF